MNHNCNMIKDELVVLCLCMETKYKHLGGIFLINPWCYFARVILQKDTMVDPICFIC